MSLNRNYSAPSSASVYLNQHSSFADWEVWWAHPFHCHETLSQCPIPETFQQQLGLLLLHSRLINPNLNFAVVVPKFVSMVFALFSHPSHLNTRCSCFDTHSSCTDNHYPLADFFQLNSIWVRDLDDGGLGSGGVVAATWDLTRVSREMTLDLSADMVFYVAACCTYNKLGSSMSCFKSIMRCWNSLSLTDGGLYCNKIRLQV